jgi:hypothetical protein
MSKPYTIMSLLIRKESNVQKIIPILAFAAAT